MPATVDRLRRDARAAYSNGWVLMADLITAIGVFTGVGFILDRWLGTGPVLLAVGIMAGYAMGIYITFWRIKQMKQHAGERNGS